VSNAIRYDSLLLAALARTLDSTLSGRAVRAVRLDRQGRILAIRLAATVRRGGDTILAWHLNPSAGDLTLAFDGPSAGSTVQVAPGSSIARVYTLPDERILCFDLDAHDSAAGFARRIVVELVGVRWNVFALGASDVITAALQVRERDGVVLRPGATYVPPHARTRVGADTLPSCDEFAAVLRAQLADEPDVRRALVAAIAYTSPINATFIATPLAARVDDETLRSAYDRYATLLAADGGWILPGGRGQPYPAALGIDGAENADSLLDAFKTVASRAAVDTAPVGDLDVARAAVHERLRRIDERIAKLTSEYTGAAAEAERLRRNAGLLLAQLHVVARGRERATLDAFDGTTVDVTLDPSLSAKDNAATWYDQAKRRELAAERVPALLDKADRERTTLMDVATRLRDGEATAEEIVRWSAAPRQARAGEAPVVLPYRVYRTTGGLEVRVGRNSRSNDALTFHHASPDDIWMHARDLAGAHVVLRWKDRTANPPARDLEQAAVIAAVNSRGRTSALVPVDWTRRKYVRKPRKAPPGRVVVERSKTLFVQPDAKLDRALRADEEI
jgi:predicted ribosome quality control (RQC) complex YloA/Tae2 family protein